MRLGSRPIDYLIAGERDLVEQHHLRAEYEFIQFTSFGQFENIAGIPNVVEFPAHGVTLNSLRLALGYKF